MSTVTVVMRRRKVRTDQMGHTVPELDGEGNIVNNGVTYEGDEADVNPDQVVMIRSAGKSPPDSDHFVVTMSTGHDFYVDVTDKAKLQ